MNREPFRIDIWYAEDGECGVEYKVEDGWHTIETGLDGVYNAVLTAKKWLREHGIKNADINEPFGVIWEVRGSVIKRVTPVNYRY